LFRAGAARCQDRPDDCAQIRMRYEDILTRRHGDWTTQ
jgi:hypothetical protein